MRRGLKAAFIAAGVALAAPGAALAAEEAPSPPEQNWTFDGIFGTYNQAQLQRGFQVYQQVCAACHAMSLMSYRNLLDMGVPEDAATEIAAGNTVTDGPNDQGEMFERPAVLADRFRSPFPNANAARAANNGAYPPDLSLMTKARADGADYVYGLLTGYVDPPSNVEVSEGMYYNLYFPGHQIAMAPPLSEGGVQYADQTPPTVENMARDVTAFMQFAADPHLEERKRTGTKVILFLLVLTAMLYAVKRKVWADVH